MFKKIHAFYMAVWFMVQYDKIINNAFVIKSYFVLLTTGSLLIGLLVHSDYYWGYGVARALVEINIFIVILLYINWSNGITECLVDNNAIGHKARALLFHLVFFGKNPITGREYKNQRPKFTPDVIKLYSDLQELTNVCSEYFGTYLISYMEEYIWKTCLFFGVKFYGGNAENQSLRLDFKSKEEMDHFSGAIPIMIHPVLNDKEVNIHISIGDETLVRNPDNGTEYWQLSVNARLQ